MRGSVIRSLLFLAVLLAFSALVVCPAQAQYPPPSSAAPSSAASPTPSGNGVTHGKKTVRPYRTESPITLDGNLDEPAWQEATVTLGFTQKDPQEGAPSTEKTEFRVLYTAKTLYVGVICYDSDAQGILATDRRRDSKLENNDKIG